MIKVKSRYNKKKFCDIASSAFKILGLEGELLVEVDFMESDEMQGLNMRTRNIDKVTDVLSFPYLNEFSKAYVKENFPLDYNEKAKGVEIGCIAICKSYIKKSAEEDNTVYICDVYRAFTHGLLHLLGYDHEKEEEFINMNKQENAILVAAGVKI